MQEELASGVEYKDMDGAMEEAATMDLRASLAANYAVAFIYDIKYFVAHKSVKSAYSLQVMTELLVSHPADLESRQGLTGLI